MASKMQVVFPITAQNSKDESSNGNGYHSAWALRHFQAWELRPKNWLCSKNWFNLFNTGLECFKPGLFVKNVTQHCSRSAFGLAAKWLLGPGGDISSRVCKVWWKGNLQRDLDVYGRDMLIVGNSHGQGCFEQNVVKPCVLQNIGWTSYKTSWWYITFNHGSKQ